MSAQLNYYTLRRDTASFNVDVPQCPKIGSNYVAIRMPREIRS